jgi:hypothetical protein
MKMIFTRVKIISNLVGFSSRFFVFAGFGRAALTIRTFESFAFGGLSITSSHDWYFFK